MKRRDLKVETGGARGARRRWGLGLATLALLCAAPMALACRVAQGKAPWEERLAKAPEAFVGRVSKVGPDWVEFEVARSIKGAQAAGTVARRAVKDSTCSLSFEPGQWWIYAGSFGFSPSLRLRGPELEGGKSAPSARASKWAQGCAEADACVPVAYGCGAMAWTPASKTEAARADFYAHGGNPATLDCAFATGEPQPGAFGVCEAGSCQERRAVFFGAAR